MIINGSKIRRKIKKFFEYRFSLKITVMIFAVLGLLQNMFPALKIPGVQYFLFQTFIYFILFDLFYELAGLKFDTIYNGLNSFFRVIQKSRLNVQLLWHLQILMFDLDRHLVHQHLEIL